MPQFLSISNLRVAQFSKLVAALIGAFGVMIGNAHAQQVALLDSGVDPTRGFNVVGGFNFFANTDDTSDVSTRPGEGDGTVAVRAVSEAFAGEIVPFVVTDGDLSGSSEAQVRVARDNALADILGQSSIRVVGITWGTTGITGASAPLISNLAASDRLIAINAGNESGTQPNALSSSSVNLSGVIIVGGADATGTLLPTTNRAGTTANRYVAAIGLPEPGATVGDSAFATARIAGIAGAVLLQNPNLTAEQVANVIFDSAEDRGEVGTDNEYGRGVILSAAQVLNNVIGPVEVPTEPVTPPVTDGGGGGGGGGGGAGALLIGGAVAGALLLLRKPSTKLEKTLVLDSYGRAFELDLNDQIQVNDGALHLSQFFQNLDQKSINSGFVVPGLNTQVAFSAAPEVDQRIDFIEYFALPGDSVLDDQQANVSFAIASQLNDQLGLTAGYRVSPEQEFGGLRNVESHAQFGVSSFISGQAFSSVLSGFSPQAQTASLAYTPKRSSKTSLKLGLVSVDQAQRFGQDSLSTLFEGGYEFSDNAGLAVQFGQIQENGSLFGGAAGGTFGVESATTYAINLAGHIKASDKFSFVGNYGVGHTSVDAAENSLLNGFSNIRSDWYSLGLIGNNLFRTSDQFGLAFSQPLKIRDGEVDFSLPTNRAANGDILFDTERVNLSDTGATERTLEAYYRTMLDSQFEVGIFASYRQNPNHVSERGDEALMMATLRYWR